MTLTETYARIHEALLSVAAAYGVAPFSVRTLLAVADSKGVATTETIPADLHVDGSAVRRAILELYDRGMLLGTGIDGRSRRRGVRTRLELTDFGQGAVDDVRILIDSPAEALAS